MAAMMVLICVAMIIGSYRSRTEHEVNQPTVETRHVHVDRTTHPEQEK